VVRVAHLNLFSAVEAVTGRRTGEVAAPERPPNNRVSDSEVSRIRSRRLSMDSVSSLAADAGSFPPSPTASRERKFSLPGRSRISPQLPLPQGDPASQPTPGMSYRSAGASPAFGSSRQSEFDESERDQVIINYYKQLL